MATTSPRPIAAVERQPACAGEAFWREALAGSSEAISEASSSIFRRIWLPGSELRLLVQLVPEPKTCKSRVHLDIETDDVDAEVARLERLGAARVRHVVDRGFRFWVLADPSGTARRRR